MNPIHRANILNYLDAHPGWPYHYLDTGDGVIMLGMLRNWAEKHMPEQGYGDGKRLSITMLDTETGQTFPVGYSMYYDELYGWEFCDARWNPVDFSTTTTLNRYSYAEHYCPCNRKLDAEGADIDTDEECAGERFKIARIEATNFPGLILYSETMSIEELEAHLQQALILGTESAAAH